MIFRSKRLFITIALLAAVAAFVILARANKEARWNLPQAPGVPLISKAPPEKLAQLPADAAIIYQDDGYIYVTDKAGKAATQITFERPQGTWEHEAVSPDHRFIAANEQMPDPKGRAGGIGRLWLYDLKAGTRQRLAPDFAMAGNGGVDWDRGGNVYFAGRPKDIYAAPKTPEEFKTSASANDIYRIRYDGTGLKQLTKTADRGESDVSVSEDGKMIAYNCFEFRDEASEIWVSKSDGSAPHRVLVAGKSHIDSVHDPELSPDNKHVVYSRVNSSVPPNFPDNPDANTSHDLYVTNVDGSGTRRITKPGHIAICPDWVGGDILYLDVSEKERHGGLSMIKASGQDQPPSWLPHGTNLGKFIPR